MKNVSVRAFVGPRENALILGFRIADDETTVLITGLGPSLAKQNVSDALERLRISLHSAEGHEIAANEGWRTGSDSEYLARRADLTPKDDREAAVKITLAAGPYTAILSTVGESSGWAVMSIYELGE